MIDALLKSIKNDKQSYLNAKTGKDFEERIASFLHLTLGLTRVLKRDISKEDWKTIQGHVSNKFGSDYLDLPSAKLKKTFIYQPYGSQQFPDILIFSNKKVIPLEIKFSTRKQPKPIWNSNVPRANAFYIFGSYGLNDITFFCGNDIVNPKHREALYGFFSDIKNLEDKIRTKMPELDSNNRGFTPYIRAAFDQRKHKKEVVTNFFTHPSRIQVENLAIEKAKTL